MDRPACGRTPGVLGEMTGEECTPQSSVTATQTVQAVKAMTGITGMTGMTAFQVYRDDELQ